MSAHLDDRPADSRRKLTPDSRDTSAPKADRLWRHVMGEQLRAKRVSREETLRTVGRRAGVSTQYLSEVERGRKEASSEVLAALLRALESNLLDLTSSIGEELGSSSTRRDAASKNEFRLAA